MLRTRSIVAGLLGTGVLAVGVASAHEVGASRLEAPIPLVLLYVGAAATVLSTAAWVGLSGWTGTATTARSTLGTIDGTTAGRLALVARVAFAAAVGLAVVDGLVGTGEPTERFAMAFVWPVWVKGLGLVAVAAGSPWRVLSPWRALYDALGRLEDADLALVGRYPARLGAWPAFLGFVVLVGIVENLTVVPQVPRATAGVVAGYAFVMYLGAVAFGPAWFRNADPLSVLYRQLGRVAPVRFVRQEGGAYAVRVRAPWTGCVPPVTGPALVAFVVAVVYTVSFDGFIGTPEYRSLLFALRGTAGIGPTRSVVVYLAGLAAFLGSFLLACAVVERLGSGGERDATGSPAHGTTGDAVDGDRPGSPDGGRAGAGWGGAARAFAPTVLPIAAAYEVAHNYPFVLDNAGRLLTLALDATVGSGGGPIDLLGWLSLGAFWGSQVLLIVAGHVVAVVAAHLVAVRRYGSVAAARRGHLPLVAVMIGYTVVSLWIVSRPVIG